MAVFRNGNKETDAFVYFYARVFFFCCCFLFWWYWGLTLGLSDFYACALRLEP
jgi:hypothetical protein